jgi:hypothetical protein
MVGSGRLVPNFLLARVICEKILEFVNVDGRVVGFSATSNGMEGETGGIGKRRGSGLVRQQENEL